MASFKQHLSFSRIDELSNQLERMMEASFEPGCKGDDGNKSNKNRNLRSAHHSRNFESTIMARINNVEERLLQTSNTLEKILEIVSLTSHVRIFSQNLYLAPVIIHDMNRCTVMMTTNVVILHTFAVVAIHAIYYTY